ncbi:MAG TPA: histidine kinase [Nonomuraea sp.]|nr:histidine kinase [Nonomuraea sp.]
MGASARLIGVGPRTLRIARLTAGGFAVGMAVFVAVPVAEALRAFSPGRAAAALILLTGLTACYLWLVVSAVADRPAKADLPVLSTMTGLSAAAPFVAGPTWWSIGFMLPAAFALTLRGWRAAAGFAAALAGGAALAWLGGGRWVGYGAVQNLLTAGALVGMVLFAALLRELHRTREELAALAVTEERLRFARELHDVLGHNLSVIAMKTELAMRISAGQRERLQAELADIHDAARRSLRDVRAVVKGYREMSLEREIGGVRRVLQTAGVRCEFEPLPAHLDREIRVALAWALREGATNILRHSRATVCRLAVEEDEEHGRIEIRLSNDGAGAGEGDTDGSGLAGVQERLAQVGGTSTRQTTQDDWFHLVLDVPRGTAAASPVPSSPERT